MLDTALAKILAKPLELLAWDLRRPNAMTLGMKIRTPHIAVLMT